MPTIIYQLEIYWINFGIIHSAYAVRKFVKPNKLCDVKHDFCDAADFLIF